MCLANVQIALKEMKEQTLNSAWKKLWPDVVHDYEGFAPEEIQNAAVGKAVKLARLLRETEGFANMMEEDVKDVGGGHYIH